MNGQRVIDLDRPEPIGEPERRPYAAGGRPSRIGLAMLVPVCLAAFAGAAGTPAPALSQVGVIPSFLGVLPDDSLPTLAAGLVVAQSQGEVFAHHPDGRPAWRTRPFPDAGGENALYQLIAWEDAIVLSRISLRTAGDAQRPSAIVSAGLDPATGHARWLITGLPTRAGGLVVVMPEPWAGPTSARVYRSLPDDLLWTAPAARTAVLDPGTDALLALTEQGRFTEYELTTGTARRTAQLLLPTVPGGDELTMWLFRDRLTLRAAASFRPGLAGQSLSYDRATLQPAAPSPLDRYIGLTECGPVLCAPSVSGQGTSILDSDSLAELWRLGGGGSVSWTDAGLLVHATEPRLVDVRTGKTLVDASGWTPVGNLRTSPMTPVIMTLRVSRRTYVARLTPRTVRVLGSIPQGLTGCVHEDLLLACRAASGRTEVWRLNARL